MLMFEIETGKVRITVNGENAFIQRKNGKKINVSSAEEEARLIEEFQKTKDSTKIDKFRKEYPKLMEGDTVISGKKTKIHLDISYNKGKDKPVDDYKSRVSKTILMGPNSELQLTGFEEWDKTDSKTKERHYGESVKTVSLKKGFFHVSFSHTDDPFLTPVASISVMGGDGSGFFDVCEDAVYSSPVKSTSTGATGMSYTNLRTKKSFIAKSSSFEEIIVTPDAIYRRGVTNMDDIFQYNIQILGSLQEAVSGGMVSLNANDMASSMKNLSSTTEQAISGLEMMKQMSPDDLIRLMKKGGAQVSPEVMEKIKEMPEMIKMMEKRGTLSEMKKASAIAKGYTEGMGNENIERMAKRFTKGTEGIKKKSKELKTVEGKDIEEILEHPRKYKPLTEESGAVKIG